MHKGSYIDRNKCKHLKSTHLLVTQGVTKSWSILTAFVLCNLRFSQVHLYYSTNKFSTCYYSSKKTILLTRIKN